MMKLCIARCFSAIGAAAIVLFGFTATGRAVDASADGGAGAEADADSSATDTRSAEIRALIQGTLPVAIAAQSLFEVSLTDESAVQVERVRLKALLQSADERVDGGTRKSMTAKSAASDSKRSLENADARTLDSPQWRAQEELDRARFEFYSLSQTERNALLQAQAARVDAAKPKETPEQKLAREAEEERARALDAARVARSEAERLVGKELARLIDVEQSVRALQAQFKDSRAALADRKDSLLGWQRRVTEAEASAASADETYDAVRRTLRESRNDLDRALDELASSASNVPNIGPDPLSDVPADIATEPARQRRKQVEGLIFEARGQETALRAERASTLLDEIDALNKDRLGLLSSLSPGKRAGITGFTKAGFDQSQSEARQLLLILRYHRYIASGWLGDLRRRQGIKGVSAWGIAAVVVPWVLAVLAFIWLRRRSPHWLAAADERLSAADRRERRSAPSFALRAVRFVAGFYRTIEWLLFFASTIWLLPPAAVSLLELQLLEVIVGWTLGGALIVNVVNSIAANAGAAKSASADELGRLRLRSLRLVGRVIVAFVLVLLVSARLVGKGTVYNWVYSTCWFAAMPVFLILVRWWRDIVFERVDRVRRKSEIQTWILANRSGWKSFFAAMVGAVQLFTVGAYRILRNWVTSFNLARRAHAYLFRRELARLANDSPLFEAASLNQKAFAALAPSTPTQAWVDCSLESELDLLTARAKARRGGVVAIVGPRGMGKSSLARQLQSRVEGARTFDCSRGLGIGELEALVAERECPPLVILDDAQGLIQLVRDGLRAFDEVFAFARAQSDQTLWAFAIDSVVWPFLSRARDSRPLFDSVVLLRPWTDEQVGSLLSQRCEEAEIAPTFEDLLDKLPGSADEIDKQEALAARRAGYFRMVWDYARGNPAMALEVWRASLREDATGQVRVGPLAAPNATQLELLPDSALFILRAILQLDTATVSDLAKATRIAEAAVSNVVKYGLNHGYLHEEAHGVRVAWPWLRAVVLHLERRHLLVNP